MCVPPNARSSMNRTRSRNVRMLKCRETLYELRYFVIHLSILMLPIDGFGQ